MNKYKKLAANTLLFGIATFSTKILTFVMMPIITRLLSPEDFSTSELVFSTCNFIVPMISVCIHEAVIRFGLDKAEKKSDVFTSAVLTIMAGYLLLILCFPILGLVTRIKAYRALIYVYVLTSALRSTTTHFVRASGFTRMFALDGFFTTALTVGFIYLLVAKLQLGIVGYVCATIIADAVSSLTLIVLLKLHRFFRPRNFNKGTLWAMLRYSAPLMPTALFWWITNLSDRYLVDWISGPAVNGLYTAAYKIPTVITLVSTIFIQAWQISAFTEEEGRGRFYTTVFSGYSTLVFVAASGLILMIKPITRILVAPDYYESWRYVPFLVLAVAFSCLVTFLGTIYNVAKSNRMVTITTLIGAVINLVLNLALIPQYGANGAAFATFISYFTVFLIRAVDSRRYIDIKIQPVRVAANLVLLMIQILAVLWEVPQWIAIEIAVFVMLILGNIDPIVTLLKQLRRQL